MLARCSITLLAQATIQLCRERTKGHIETAVLTILSFEPEVITWGMNPETNVASHTHGSKYPAYGLRKSTTRFVFVPAELLSTPQQFAVFVNF